ncbi:hypothetical protein [Halomonas sp. BMC6]|uniref:hypothetical protein n=1 Tax=Halomonas sp. BMC6 TaxID=3073244 RepID=UPI0030CD8051
MQVIIFNKEETSYFNWKDPVSRELLFGKISEIEASVRDPYFGADFKGSFLRSVTLMENPGSESIEVKTPDRTIGFSISRAFIQPTEH